MARWGNSMSPLKELQAHPSDVYALSRRERLCCSPWGLWTECAPQMASQSPSGASSPRGTRCSRKPCGRRPSTLVLLLHFCGREGGGGAESSRNSGRLVPEWEMGLRLSPERQGDRPGLRLKGSTARNGYGELSQRIPEPTGVRSHTRPTVNVCQEHSSTSLARDDDTKKEGGYKS